MLCFGVYHVTAGPIGGSGIVASPPPNVTTATGVLPSANGGTGVANAGTLTNATATTITGGGTIALGGYTLTAAATGTIVDLGTNQTITGLKTFGNLGLKVLDTASDHATTIKQNSDEAAARVLNIPALGGDDTVMTLGTTQDVTGLKTITDGTHFVRAQPGGYIDIFRNGGTCRLDGLNGGRFVISTGNASGIALGGVGDTAHFIVSQLGISSNFKGGDVPSASAIVPTGNVFHVTGTDPITSITATNIVAGTVLTLIFDGTLTSTGFTDGNNLKLVSNFVATADDTITLVFDGTNFYEIARSIN